LTAVDFATASLVVLLGAAIQGSVGFGYALIAAPLLALIDPALVPGPLLFSSLFLTLLMALRERSSMDVSGMGWALAGRVPGSLVGAALLGVLAQEAAGLTIALVILVAVALSASGLRVQPSAGALIAAGAASGFMGTVSSIGGPPLALLYQHAAGSRLRSTLAGLFVFGAVVSLLSLALFGRFGPREVRVAVALLPGMLGGLLLSVRIAPILDGGYTRTAVLAVSGAAGAALLVRQLF
jgi:uncharacterized membrane protein YfcA